MDNNEKLSEYAEEYKTKSGFTLSITPLPPYYMDIIGDMYPLLDLPRREIILHAGDVFTEEYEIPENPPDEFEEDYELYIRTMDVKFKNEQVEKKRFRVKRDMLLSLCVHIINGPLSIDDQEWKDDVEAPFVGDGMKVPEHPGALKLMFLKVVVISDADEGAAIQQIAIFREVSLQGIGTALSNFQDNLGQFEALSDIIEGQEELAEAE